jgi:hypothetical protein
MILYECDKFKVEQTEHGEMWTIHPGCSALEAQRIYKKYREDNPVLAMIAHQIMDQY